jgi:DHA2 family multidrug resistance protein-like MFS transporter
MRLGADTGAPAGRREYIGLAVLGLPTVLVALDTSVLYLALPHVAGDLRADSVEQLWITDIYGFVLAGLLVTMGTLGERIGRKRLLLIGGVCFAAASVLAAYSTSPGMLIATRALLGIAGSTIMPSTMALIGVMFPDRRQHATAIAVWMGCFMGGTALGPVVGGALLEFFWWGSVFLIGIPVMVLLLILGPVFLPEYRDPAAGRLDPLSVGLSLAAVLLLVFGLKESARSGAGVPQFAAIGIGLAVGALFLRRQRGLTHPLLDLRLFRNRTFTTGLLLTLSAGLIAAHQLFVSFYLQSVERLSPLATALWLLPSTLSMVICIQLAPLVIRHIRPAHVISAGLAVASTGLLVLTLLDGSPNLPLTITGLVIANTGIAPMAGLCAVLALQAVPPQRAGSAAALTETAGEFGVAMGVATVGVVGTVVYQRRLQIPATVPADLADAARQGIGGAMAAAEDLPAGAAADLLDGAHHAVTAGLQASAGMCATFAVAAAVMVLIGIRHVPPTTAAPTDEAHGAPPPTIETPGATSPTP